MRVIALLAAVAIGITIGAVLVNAAMWEPRDTFRVSIETPEQIKRNWNSRGHSGHALGFTSWESDAPEGLECIIHVPPLTRQTRYIWEHEIRHCAQGHFHSLRLGDNYE